MESGHQLGLDILNLKLLFILMFNYMKIFDSVTITCLKFICIYSPKFKQLSQLAK